MHNASKEGSKPDHLHGGAELAVSERRKECGWWAKIAGRLLE